MKPVASDSLSNKSIMDKALCLSLTLSRLWTSRAVPSGVVEVNADKTLIHVSKTILDSPELKAVEHLDDDIRRYLDTKRVPSRIIRHGVYLIPIELLQQVDTRLEEFHKQRDGLVEEFLGTYAKKVKDAQGRLKDLFDPADYPPVKRVRYTFDMQFSYISFSTPSVLKSISKEIFKRETEKAQATVARAAEDIRDAMRVGFSDLVSHMVERLSGEDGKPKRFKESSLKRISEFLDTFSARDITDDIEMDALVGKARQILSGVDPKSLRKDADLRTQVVQRFSEIKQILDTLVVDRPGRAVSLEDEE